MTITVTRGTTDMLLADKHAPYVTDAETNFDLYISQVVPEQVDGRDVYDFTKPRKHTLTAGGTWWFPSVPEIDETNDFYLKVLDVAPGDVVWDIGAYSGRSTLAFAEAVGEHGRVIALEPDPSNCVCVITNLWGRENVDIRKWALWSSNGTALFEADGNQGSGITAPRTRQRVPATTVTPKSLMEKTAAPTVVKIDIEGAEYGAVPKFAAIFDTARPRFVIECHHDCGKTATELVPTLVDFFHSNGYWTEILDQPEPGPFPLLQAWPL